MHTVNVILIMIAYMLSRIVRGALALEMLSRFFVTLMRWLAVHR